MSTAPANAPANVSARMPTWFIPHGGGPCFFMDWNPPDAWDHMADFLKKMASTLARTPKAIVMVSARWAKSHFAVTRGAQPDLIYDYYGFPPHAYELKYPAPGAPVLADQIVKTLSTMPSAGSKLGYLGSAGLFINYLATIFMTPFG